MNIRKAAAVRSSGRPEEAQLAKINRYSKTPLTAGEVYSFSVRLCDDQPDRDFERFDTAALPLLAELFRGKTGILDHEWSADCQVARVFDTEVLQEAGVTFLLAHCYMLRSEKNADLIRDIEGGIKKEVSVGCAVAEALCSLCGSPYGSCEHQKGAFYDGRLCIAVLGKPLDAYEFSFVAVPAQREAGVLKKGKGGVFMTLNELVKQAGTPELSASLKALEQEAQFGQACREAAVNEAISLGLLLAFGAKEEPLRKAFSALDNEELMDLKRSMAQKAAELFPPEPQLPAAAPRPGQLDTAYLI